MSKYAAFNSNRPAAISARPAGLLSQLAWLVCGALLACCLAGLPHGAHAAPGASQWSSLTPAQQQALGPLAPGWNSMTPERQQKWLAFAGKYQNMSPDEQQRSQQKMDAWVKLTPEQHLAARENYLRSNKLPPEQRKQKWEEYQQLPDEQKAQLASHTKKPLITNLPTPAESKQKKLQPLKTPRRPVASASPASARPLAPAAVPSSGGNSAAIDPANSTR